MTDITKKYRSRFIVCWLLSLFCWLGLCGFLVIYGMSKSFFVVEGAQGVVKQLEDIFVPLAVSYIVALVIFIFVKEKMRTCVWIVNIVLSAALLGDTLMYVSLALFALDEFILVPMYKHFKNKFSINKEIDKRT